MWVLISSAVVVTIYAAAAISAYQAAATARTPQGAVGWVVFLALAPFLAVPAYLFLGHHRMRGYLVARHEAQRVVEAIRDFGLRLAPEDGVLSREIGPLEHCAKLPVVRGNGARVLIDGPDAFQAIFQAIDAAEHYVLVQFYIVRDDGLGQQLQQHLLAAAARGVRVLFMTDAVGSLGLKEPYYAALRDAGVQVVDPRKSRGPRHRFQINYRNHRKTVIVDGHVGFTGGLNVGDEYLGKDPAFGHWRDTHIRLTGPMVTQLQLIFVEDWHWATDETQFEHLHWTPHADPDGINGLIVATGPADSTETGSLMFFSAISEARRRIWISSPYFVPDIAVLTALCHAARSGVDVRLVVPDMADHRMPWLAAFSYFDDVLEAGVRVYRYRDGFLHQKAFVVDDDMVGIGTTNLDNRSFRLNFETMAVLFDTDLAAQVDTMLRADMGASVEMTRRLADQPPQIRYAAPVARLFSPLL